MMKMHEKNVWDNDNNRAVTSGDVLLIRGTIRGQRGWHPGAQWYAYWHRLNADKKQPFSDFGKLLPASNEVFVTKMAIYNLEAPKCNA